MPTEVVIVGANQINTLASRESFELIHMTKGGASWTLDKATAVYLPGAHGSEIVRSFCVLDAEQVVFTAGEDGCIKAWKPPT